MCDISALEVLRAMGASTLEVTSGGRMGLLHECGAPGDIVERSPFASVVSTPVHYLVLHDGSCRYRCDDVAIRRVCSRSVRGNVLLQVHGDLLITGPELTFATMAARLLSEGRDKRAANTIRLARIGFELCGRYALDSANPEGFSIRGASLTGVDRICHLLDGMAGCKGVPLAKNALSLVQDGARSPMEATLSLLLCAPRHLGGIGLSGGKINYRLMTADGRKEVDLAFPESGFGLEYQGRLYHSPEGAKREDRRRNALAGSGITILPVWYEDVAYIDRFNRLVALIARLMGVRVRIRSKEFAQRQRVLRSLALPAVRRFGE